MSEKVVANKRPEHTGDMSGPPGPGRGTGEKAANFRVSGRRLMGRLAPQWLAVGSAIILCAFGVGLNVLAPTVLGSATDRLLAGVVGAQFPDSFTREQVIIEQQAANPKLAELLTNLDFQPGVGIDFEAIGWILALALALHVASAAVMITQGWVLNRAVQRTIYRMRADVSAKIERLPLSYFDRQPRGELLSRVTNDIDNVSQTLQQTLTQLLNSLLMIIGVLSMMFWLSPLLALVALISVPIAMVVVGGTGSHSQKLFKENWRATGELTAHIEEAFTGHCLVKVYGRRREVEEEFAARNNALTKAGFGAQFASGIIMPVMFLVGNLNYVLIAVLGALRVASGVMSIGEVQAFIQYSRQFTQPLTQVASMSNLLQSGVASAERVFELLDAQEMSVEPVGELAKPVRGAVRFEDIYFSYSPDVELIRALSLNVEPGQSVAIVGPTGSGKTTLVNLLMRFYDLDAGRILLDGVDISAVPRAELRSQMAMVLQDAWLFGGTIGENIAYGRPDASEEEILAAARATFVDRFVHSLPEGYDTVIDEEGSNVSAGERQLITIARAFLTDPALLILDEATSSVDTRTELLLQKAMASLRQGRTSFVIAHRLSTIRDADLILVLENGRIVEQGNHEELLAKGGSYFELHNSQLLGTAE